MAIYKRDFGDIGFIQSRRKIEGRRAAATARADEAAALMGGRVEPSEGQAQTLGEATVVRIGGDSATIPVLRVKPEMVAAWWIVSAKFKGKTGALVGVAF